jgi:hypothetical protein
LVAEEMIKNTFHLVYLNRPERGVFFSGKRRNKLISFIKNSGKQTNNPKLYSQ